jgi:hypothetical protein
LSKYFKNLDDGQIPNGENKVDRAAASDAATIMKTTKNIKFPAIIT